MGRGGGRIKLNLGEKNVLFYHQAANIYLMTEPRSQLHVDLNHLHLGGK